MNTLGGSLVGQDACINTLASQRDHRKDRFNVFGLVSASASALTGFSWNLENVSAAALWCSRQYSC